MSISFYMGFHGSDVERCEQICSNTRYHISNSEEEWLGNGIYFFENDIAQAEYWCTTVKQYNEWGIVKSDIEATVVIDMLLIENIRLFERVAKEVKNKYLKLKDGTKRKIVDAVIFNMMYALQAYDMVRCVFDATYIKVSLERSRIKPMQIQLCVRHRDCIKTYERVR
jgi:hypothetical protein